MRIFSAMLSGVAVAALATSAGMVLPADTLALGAGVLCGALAALPVTAFIGAALPAAVPAPLPGDHQPEPAPVSGPPPFPRLDAYSPVRDYPPVVIINPATMQAQRRPALAPAASAEFAVLDAQRQFRVIGEAANA